MANLIRLTATLLWTRWPVLLAWFLFGTLVRYVAVEAAGFVGAYNEVVGVLLLPLAVLGRLVALVAMLLVLRDGMSALRGDIPTARSERRAEFSGALLAGLLPFIAFYAAQGYLAEDVFAYYERLLSVNTGILMTQLVEDIEAGTSGSLESDGTLPGELIFSPITISLIVVAFVLRWLWGRYRARLHRSLTAAAVYLELLWIYLATTLVADGIGLLTGWVATRQGTVWLGDIREAVTDWFSPITAVWDTVVMMLGLTARATLEPLAWLTIAGVIYGQAIAAASPAITDLRAARLRERYTKLPEQVRQRVTDLTSSIASRFRPIWSALLLMWRAGPALVGAYILCFTIVLLIERLAQIALIRLIGPHDIFAFWMVVDSLVFLIVPIIVEPLRIAVVASAYNETREVLAQAPITDGAAPGSAETREVHEEPSGQASTVPAHQRE